MHRVTLVIPTFNRGVRIARTLDSALVQTLALAEIIVVDDGSSDGTGEWVRAHYPSIRVITTDNRGPCAAINTGAAAASNELLVFLDHDDELLPHAIETLVSLLETFPEARAAYADHTLDELGTFYRNHHTEQPAFARLARVPAERVVGDLRLYLRPIYYALLWGNLLQQPWAVYRDTFHDLGGYAPEIWTCADWDIYLNVAYAVPLAVTDRVISNHYIEGASNLTRAPRQHEMQMKVLYRQLSARGWRDPRASLIIRRRLGLYLKAAGDEARGKGIAEAWHFYIRSFANWPFDHVVAARTAIWLGQIALGRG